MRREILAEDFVNASEEYSSFCNAMFDRFRDDPIMCCLIKHLNKLSSEYYTAIMNVYNSGMTLDEAMKMCIASTSSDSTGERR